MEEKQQTVFDGELFAVDPTDATMLKWAAGSYFMRRNEHPQVLLIHENVMLSDVFPPLDLLMQIERRRWVHHPKIVLMGKWVTIKE